MNWKKSIRAIFNPSGKSTAKNRKPKKKLPPRAKLRNFKSDHIPFLKAKHYRRSNPGENCQKTYASVLEILDQIGVEYFTGGMDPWCPSINIAGPDALYVVQSLSYYLGEDGLVGARLANGRVVSLNGLGEAMGRDRMGATLLCVEGHFENEQTNFAAVSWIRINVWRKREIYSGQTIYDAAFATPFAKRVREKTFQNLCATRGALEDADPFAATGVPFPIDVVYTWVDGNDAEWQDLKRSYMPDPPPGEEEAEDALEGQNMDAAEDAADPDAGSADIMPETVSDLLGDTLSDETADATSDEMEDRTPDEIAEATDDTDAQNMDPQTGETPEGGRGVMDERFRNRDELMYSLRSLEMFAPFVRHIYLVTNGQVPDWLDTDNDRITVVTHEEIYANADHLPTFNSSSIETQLHHIPGLSEHFLYFNDDFLLGQFVTPEDFFLPSGIMKFFASDQRVFRPDIDETSEEYIMADRNAQELMEQKYGAYSSQIMKHVPYPSRKSFLQKLEDSFPEAYAQCAQSKFRSADDLRPIAFMQYHAGQQEGIAVPGDISHRYLPLWQSDVTKQFKAVSDSRKYKTICINDVGVKPENLTAVNEAVAVFMENYLPFKSSFEK